MFAMIIFSDMAMFAMVHAWTGNDSQVQFEDHVRNDPELQTMFAMIIQIPVNIKHATKQQYNQTDHLILNMTATNQHN